MLGSLAILFHSNAIAQDWDGAAPPILPDRAAHLDDATWHAHLAGRPLPTVSSPAAARHDLVALDFPTWYAHLAGLDEAA